MIRADEEDEDDEMDVEIDEEAEEEHLAPAYPVVVALPATAPSAEETEPFETDESAATPPPHPAYRMTARITIPEPLPEKSSAAAAARPAGGLRADYGFVATMDRQIRRDPERYVGYGITDSWDEIVETLQGAPVSTDTELGAHMREFESMVRRDTDEIYTSSWRLRLGCLERSWGYGGELSDASDLAHGEVISLRTTVHAQMSEITELQSADLRRQRAMSDLLETDRRRREEMRELGCGSHSDSSQYSGLDCYADILQSEMIPLAGTGHSPLQVAGDSLTGR
ncbi:hypothetical protein Tco_0218527 [Tanacetum coccineum]